MINRIREETNPRKFGYIAPFIDEAATLAADLGYPVAPVSEIWKGAKPKYDKATGCPIKDYMLLYNFNDPPPAWQGEAFAVEGYVRPGPQNPSPVNGIFCAKE